MGFRYFRPSFVAFLGLALFNFPSKYLSVPDVGGFSCSGHLHILSALKPLSRVRLQKVCTIPETLSISLTMRLSTEYPNISF